MTAEGLLGRLERVKPSGGGWIASCPAHHDRSPSLSIKKGRDGRILLRCFAGCALEAICTALRIRVSDLFAVPREKCAPLPRVVLEAEHELSALRLRARLTPRERVLPVTIVYCDPENLSPGIARTLALAVEGEIVQAVLWGQV